MRLVLALMALLGLLLSPVAASAAARACLHGGDGPMVMQMAGDHHCCPDDGKAKPTKHDDKSCAQACAVMGGVIAALPQPVLAVLAPAGHAPHEAVAAKAFQAHPPSGVERPPRLTA